MQVEFGELKRQIAGRNRGPGVKYPPELRDQLVSTIEMLRGAGWTYPAIGEAVGLSPSAVRGFFRKPRKKAEPARARPVKVTADQSKQPCITVISPRGWRVEAPSVEIAVALLTTLPC